MLFTSKPLNWNCELNFVHRKKKHFASKNNKIKQTKIILYIKKQKK